MSSGDGRISLLVSDIDGTLVTNDKRLTQANIAAAHRLRDAGVKLSLVSSRPPAGFAMLAGPLGVTAPIGAFNGGAILNPDLSIIEETLVPADAARDALAAFAEFGLDGWLFTRDTWYITSTDGAYVPKERGTIRHEPAVVESFDPVWRRSASSSAPREILPPLRAVRSRAVGSAWYACHSQALAGLLPRRDPARLRQGRGDAPHLPRARHSPGRDRGDRRPSQTTSLCSMSPLTRSRMGNGIDALKAVADFVTEDNEHDGFAAAVDRFILAPRGAGLLGMSRSPKKISLFLADVDGTLVTHEKVLTERTKQAVADLRAAGIRFAITSGRPPKGAWRW